MNAMYLKHTFYLFALVLALSSCQDHITEKSTFHKDGGDTDEPILAGIVFEAGQTPLYPGDLELNKIGQSTPVSTGNTDEGGDFQFNLAAEGSYYLRIFQNQELLGISDTIDVQDSTYITIQF